MSGTEGLELYWQAWLPDSEPKAILIIAHGVSEHSGRYSHVGERLAAAGYAVYALDHRGHGRSEGRRAVVDRMAHIVEDLNGLIETATSSNPGKGTFLLGHSMGGAVALEYAFEHQDRLAGLILSGPAAALEAASPVTRALGRVLSTLAPSLGIFAIETGAVSRDPDVVSKYENDPLVFHGKLPARTITELTGAIEHFPERVPKLTLPLLVMHGTADRLTPPAGSKMVYERAGSSDKTLKLYNGLYHEILNEPEQGQVLSDLLEWLEARV
jgi:alpha-beta hydrolase superfamily lysophospholipase